jgi:hypothetical protein
MKKTASEKYIEKTLRKQQAMSEKAQLSFEKTHDPQTVIEYVKRSPSGAAIKETWVLEAILGWIRNDQHDLLKSAFLPRRGERSKARGRSIEAMMFVESIDKYRRDGKSLNEALISKAEITGGSNLRDAALERELTTLKNKYYRAKRIKTEVTIQETPGAYIISAFPAFVEIDGHRFPGRWQIKLLREK